MKENLPNCPKCGSKKVVRIIYGLPSRETFEEAKEGKIILGGCCVSYNSPNFHCKDCKYEWK